MEKEYLHLFDMIERKIESGDSFGLYEVDLFAKAEIQIRESIMNARDESQRKLYEDLERRRLEVWSKLRARDLEILEKKYGKENWAQIEEKYKRRYGADSILLRI